MGHQRKGIMIAAKKAFLWVCRTPQNVQICMAVTFFVMALLLLKLLLKDPIYFFVGSVSSHTTGILVLIYELGRQQTCSDPGGVPPNWRPTADTESGDTVLLTGAELSVDLENGGIRYCRKCNQFKPPRCHHCSVCGRCILNMDHHCVWVVNCVGALNYKYFLLFFVWSCVLLNLYLVVKTEFEV